jgi:glycosyltransferase involved in cell wall biosynthesis
LDVEYIRKLAQSKDLDDAFDHSGFTIVSVGRLDPVKQFEQIPGIVAKVLKEIPDARLKWYIIGGGNELVKKEIQKKVAENNLQNYVVILPFKNNVYPYIAASDLFVHTSSSETFSLVVNEAKAVCKPVLVNNYGSADEFVNDGKDGWIVPNNEMHQKIIELLNHPEKLTLVERYLQENQYDNKTIIELVKTVL